MHEVRPLPCTECYQIYRHAPRSAESGSCKCLEWRRWFSLEWAAIQRDVGLETESDADINARYDAKIHKAAYDKRLQEKRKKL